MTVVFITGTPGTGKSTVSHMLRDELSLPLIDLNQLIEDEGLYTGYHPDWGFKIVDLDALCCRLKEIIFKNLGEGSGRDGLVVEGHLSHYCEGADLVIVLRAHPAILKKRLQNKGFKHAKIQENIEAEALDICTFEAFQIHGDKVNEIDTSNKSPLKVVDLIKKIMNGEANFPVGKIDFLEYLSPE